MHSLFQFFEKYDSSPSVMSSSDSYSCVKNFFISNAIQLEHKISSLLTGIEGPTIPWISLAKSPKFHNLTDFVL